MRAPFLTVLVVALLLPGVLRADEPKTYDDMQQDLEALRRRQVPLVQQLLEARDGRQIARGATWARELTLTEVIPDLVAVLERYAARRWTVPYAAVLAVLDALVELDASVDASVLVPLVDAEQAARAVVAGATLLALRSGGPRTQLAVFDALDERDDPYLFEAWCALGNVLDRSRGPAGFGARLLGRLEVRLEVVVVDWEGEPRRVMGRIGGGCRSPTGGVPAGYPPIRRYALSQEAAEGATLLADGPTPVYLRREAGGPPVSRSFVLHDRSRDRLAWIAARLGVDPEELPLQAVHAATLRWTGAEALRRDVESEQAKLRDAWQALAARLVEAGWVRAEEAGRLAPRIRLDLRDEREAKTEPLPELQPE